MSAHELQFNIRVQSDRLFKSAYSLYGYFKYAQSQYIWRALERQKFVVDNLYKNAMIKVAFLAWKQRRKDKRYAKNFIDCRV